MLVKPGNTKDALAKYDEALKYTPNWKQLKESREAVAKQKTGFRRSEAVVRDRPLRLNSGGSLAQGATRGGRTTFCSAVQGF